MNLIARTVRFICWVGCKIYFRHRAYGLEHLPATGGYLLAGNHASYIDPVLAGISLPRLLCYIARSSLFSPAPWGAYLRALGAVPLDRSRSGKDCFRDVLDTLRDGRTVLMFPEGTRSADGRVHTERFKSGVVWLSSAAEVPIVPVYLRGAAQAWGRGQRLPRPRRTSAHFGEPVPFVPGCSEEEMLDRLRVAFDALVLEVEAKWGTTIPVDRSNPRVSEPARS